MMCATYEEALLRLSFKYAQIGYELFLAVSKLNWEGENYETGDEFDL